jgi:hypothetical protein
VAKKLGLTEHGGGAGQGLPYVILAAENSDGAFLRADQFVFRMAPGEQVKARLLALRFGKPAAKEMDLPAPGCRPREQQTESVQSELAALGSA